MSGDACGPERATVVGAAGHTNPTDGRSSPPTADRYSAFVAERPQVFEVQFTSGASGWVVVHLEGVLRDELAELVFEAWRLSAPAELVQARADRLPR